MMNIAIFTAEIPLQTQAKLLSQQLNIPFISEPEPDYDFLLILTPHHLEIKQNASNAPGAVYVDFLSDAAQYRHAQSSRNNELLAKAVGIKSNYLPSIIDATAGLGGDAFILAGLGCKIVMLERSAIIAALLQDGITRLFKNERFQHLDFSLIHSEAAAYLSQLEASHYPDVIYLDPMYPQTNKTALAKKEMRMLRAIAGDDTDADRLLQTALKFARKRVVVKRHRHAPELADKKPHFVITGRSQRFDIYLKEPIL